MTEILKVLITVKTYPLPSKKYKELVCTAGVLPDGGYIRLYPIDYRYKPYWQWYKKYQWIEVEAFKHPADLRPESFCPVKGAVITPGEFISTKNNWAERKAVVLKRGTQTMCHLNSLTSAEGSLGIIRPLNVRFKVKEDKREWKPQWRSLLDQQELFGPQRKPLEKIPYKFSYLFNCDAPGCPGHNMMIADWEIGQLYRNVRDKYGSEKTAIEKVEDKFLRDICGPDKDTYFFVGTVKRFQTWIILGTFYPLKEEPRLSL